MKSIIISGPTASQKSALALELADFKDIVVINADALQIFKGLPILSAQPTKLEQELVEHKLYSYLNHDQEISVGLWLELVKKEIDDAFKKNKIPTIVGGTGMYISKLIDGISKIPEISDEIKNEARELFQNSDRQDYIKYLTDLGEDYEFVKNLDKQRLIRAYEVIKETKKSIKYWQNNQKNFIIDPKIFTHINLEIDRELLYKNCNKRFELMFENGAIDEIKSLLQENIDDNSQITKTIGFSEIKDYLNNKIDKNETIKIASQKTRNYAKRQLTWFRHQFKDKITFDNKDKAIEYLKTQ